MTGRLTVLGTGLISGLGRGLAAHVDARHSPEGSPPRVAAETLKDRKALGRLRRADRFSKMAALAAWDAVGSAGLHTVAETSDTGIVQTTAFGPHHTTFEFLDEMLDFGESGASPTKFSHTVHNAAAAYIAIMLECRGPTCTLTDFAHPLQAGLQTALLWLREGRCAQVLVSCTEEWCDPLESMLAARGADGSGQGALRPFSLSPFPGGRFCEGSLCLALAVSGRGGFALDLEDVAEAGSLADLLPVLRRPEERGGQGRQAVRNVSEKE